MVKRPLLAPKHWHLSSVNTECSLHQLSPYIGKLKSSIASELISSYSKPNDIVVDPFAGSCTIPLEAMLLGRHAFASDISPYSKVLSKAKLRAPLNLNDALDSMEYALYCASKLSRPDLRKVPKWVRDFFHPQTLIECLKFATICRKNSNDFLMACFLGILHHQCPGFLSYPSSHLVPYLRDKKFPISKYPEMYEYRDLRSRLIKKIERTYKRFNGFPHNVEGIFRRSTIKNISFPKKFDCLITSPPYMNTLDYGRDNRLRLWFVDPSQKRVVDNPVTKQKKAFLLAFKIFAEKIEYYLKKRSYCIMIVGEDITRSFYTHPSDVICEIISKKAPSLRLISIIKDDIPDIRRSRKNCSGTKSEHILIMQKS